jgi:hypothetical protein
MTRTRPLQTAAEARAERHARTQIITTTHARKT